MSVVNITMFRAAQRCFGPGRRYSNVGRLGGRDVALNAVLSAHNVSYRIGSDIFLEDINVELQAGAVHALIGPNGAGKSTLLGVLAGDVDATAGELELFGRPLNGYSMRDSGLAASGHAPGRRHGAGVYGRRSRGHGTLPPHRRKRQLQIPCRSSKRHGSQPWTKA